MGINKTCASRKRTKKQFHTLEIRQHILQKLNLYQYDDLVFAVISDVIFFLHIKILDVLSTKLNGFDPTKQLCRNNVWFYDDRVDFMWRNKNGTVTRQVLSTCFVIMFLAGTDSVRYVLAIIKSAIHCICIALLTGLTRSLSIERTSYMYDTVSMLERIYMLQPTVYPLQPLFTRTFRGKTVPVIRSWFTTKYKKHIEDIGLNGKYHTWHGEQYKVQYSSVPISTNQTMQHMI